MDSLVVVPFGLAGLGFGVGSDYSSLALVLVELAKTKFPFNSLTCLVLSIGHIMQTQIGSNWDPR